MKLPAFALALAVALTACGGSHASAPATSQVASATGVTTSSTTAAPTTSSSGRTASSTTSAPPTTTALDAVDPATPTTSMLDHAPSTLPGAMTIPVASSAEDEAILAGYRAYTAALNAVASNPDAPDWTTLQSTMLPQTFDLLKPLVTRHFAANEVANLAGGYTLNPVVTDRSGWSVIGISDCVLDATFWMDRATGKPAAGETDLPHRVALSAYLSRVGEKWLVSSVTLGGNACGRS